MEASVITVPDDEELKKRFALALLNNPSEPFKVAQGIFGEDTGRALMASTKWPSDPLVIAFQAKAKEDLGDMHFLPTKADLARAAWDVAVNERLPVDDRLKAMRLYGDVRGFIEKQGAIINNNVLTNNKVMVVKSYDSSGEWETKLAEQQQKLIHDAS